MFNNTKFVQMTTRQAKVYPAVDSAYQHGVSLTVWQTSLSFRTKSFICEVL